MQTVLKIFERLKYRPYLRYFLTVAYWYESMSVSQKRSFGVKDKASAN